MADIGSEHPSQRQAVSTPTAPLPDSTTSTSQRKTGWLKRLGWAGFLFFLVKGLVWLAVFFGVGTLWAC